jgi:uncharacterized protein YebE (UPF0316 family)
MAILDLYPWLFVPAIFFARIVDVSMGTFRSIVAFRGFPAVAAAVGFVEILIWVAASSQVFRQMNAWPLMFAYAGGFAAGNFIGVQLESKIAFGRELLRIIPTAGSNAIEEHLAAIGYSAVALDCHIDGKPSKVLLVTLDRRKSAEVLAAIREVDPGALYTVSDVKSLPSPGQGIAQRRPFSVLRWQFLTKRK